jgi:hypothetical protein
LVEILYGGDAIVGDLAVITFNFQSHGFNQFKMVEIQICVADALAAPFSLAQQWFGIV